MQNIDDSKRNHLEYTKTYNSSKQSEFLFFPNTFDSRKKEITGSYRNNAFILPHPKNLFAPFLVLMSYFCITYSSLLSHSAACHIHLSRWSTVQIQFGCENSKINFDFSFWAFQHELIWPCNVSRPNQA